MAKTVRSPPPKARQSLLLAARRGKMARSAHAYVRGATEKFYEWLDASAARDLPDGPAIWICGDCHLGNLGPVADAAGRVEIQIRDLDQTVIGNPAHDLVRLGLSLATAVRGRDLPGVVTARMMEDMMAGYLAVLADEGAPDEPEPIAIHEALTRAAARHWRHLAKERIKDARPQIPLGRRFWSLHAKERVEIEDLMASEDIRRMVTALKSRDDDAPVEVLDAAYWVKGCSSLGRLRYAVLVGVGDRARDVDPYCLIDVKEALAPAAPGTKGAAMPRGNAERVVAGARALSPYLGERMRAARLQDRPVVVRELAPQDLKLELDHLGADEARRAARYLGAVVGKAHGRQMTLADKAAWRDQLSRRWPKGLEAPFWLWSSVVDLVGSHEAAYLDHCRRFALEPKAA